MEEAALDVVGGSSLSEEVALGQKPEWREGEPWRGRESGGRKREQQMQKHEDREVLRECEELQGGQCEQGEAWWKMHLERWSRQRVCFLTY